MWPIGRIRQPPWSSYIPWQSHWLKLPLAPHTFAHCLIGAMSAQMHYVSHLRCCRFGCRVVVEGDPQLLKYTNIDIPTQSFHSLSPQPSLAIDPGRGAQCVSAKLPTTESALPVFKVPNPSSSSKLRPTIRVCHAAFSSLAASAWPMASGRARILPKPHYPSIRRRDRRSLRISCRS
jgi:hypothetical protein